MNRTKIDEADKDFSQRAKNTIKRIPKGKVATYGQIAALAGSPRGARRVVWLLHSSSLKDKLPWHRVVNKQGEISLARGRGYEIQKQLLMGEGVTFSLDGRIDLDRFLWRPR
ncbi:MAG: MGMT family protein [Candidatus Zixiibacteriota bacterium]|nr:MAG: MGMT family protein [candidate division Zixibacteria bacterium]